MAYALHYHCKEIIPVVEIEEALRLSENLGRENVLLCGEREGQKIAGFDLGNSPQEFTLAQVKGKTIIMTTSNGTAALAKVKGAQEVYIGSFVNLSAVLKHLERDSTAIAFLCSGKLGRFSLEDTVCAGMFISHLNHNAITLNDAARVGKMLYQKYSRQILKMLQDSEHGRFLTQLGMGEDLKIAAMVDSLNVVPTLKEGRVVRA